MSSVNKSWVEVRLRDTSVLPSDEIVITYLPKHVLKRSIFLSTLAAWSEAKGEQALSYLELDSKLPSGETPVREWKFNDFMNIPDHDQCPVFACSEFARGS